MHTLIVSNPGHFHAALALRNRHALLRDEVFVYAEPGPDLDRFLALVNAFNTRQEDPAAWRLQVYRGADHLDRLISERRGNVVLMAGRNDGKVSTIRRLQSAGFAVLGDKTWLIDESDLGPLREIVAARPVALDMMTERWDVGNRLLRILSEDEEVFGGFRTGDDEPGISMVSVHHLFKAVNGAPLRRPAWYFDTAVQGEGVTDVTTHLADLALWMTDAGTACDPDRDIRLRASRQWPTVVPRNIFSLITGLEDFPASLRASIRDGALHYLCNAEVSFEVRGVGVHMEALWGLEEPSGGGDEFTTILEGRRARLFLVHDRGSNFESVVRVLPRVEAEEMCGAIERVLERHREELPGVMVLRRGPAIELAIPAALKTTHEQHFAKVLDAFLRQVESDDPPPHALSDLLAKYTLLAEARRNSTRES